MVSCFIRFIYRTENPTETQKPPRLNKECKNLILGESEFLFPGTESICLTGFGLCPCIQVCFCEIIKKATGDWMRNIPTVQLLAQKNLVNTIPKYNITYE